MVEFYFFKKLFFSLQQPVQSGHILQQQWRRGKGNVCPKTQQYFFILLLFQNAARDNGIPNAKTSRGECEQIFKK